MFIKRYTSAIIAAVFVVIAVAAPISFAQESGSGLQLSPTRSELSASPGEQKSFKLSLKNITQGDLTAKAILNDFESDGETGTPKILVDSKERTPYSINSMLEGLKDVDLAAGETKEVTLNIDVPSNAAPGAYFGAIRYSVIPKTDNSANDRQIALNASVAHLVFVEVPGDIRQQIQVEKVSFLQDDKKSSIFNKPNKAAVSIKNLGNGFARPFGTVSIKNPFGKQVASYELNNKDPRSIVLPQSSRTFTDPISGVSIPGKYNVVASAAYGNGGEVITYKASLWYLPVWFIITVLVLVLVVAGIVYKVYRKATKTKSSRKKKK